MVSKAEYDERLPFVFHTHTGSPTGYAQSAWILARAFWEAGLEVRYLFIGDDPLYEPESPDPLVNSLRSNQPDLGLPQIVYSVAPLFWHNSGAYKVGWTMMEVDGVNAQWVYACNAMDEVWVPTLWQARFFAESGVVVPIYVVPLGVDERMFSPTVYPARVLGSGRDEVGKGPGRETFRFLGVGWWQLRKRWDILVRAFLDEFKDDDNVELVIKCHTAETECEVLATLANMLEGRELTRVKVMAQSLNWWHLAGVYRACQAFVLPTAGEGYGYPFLEALCCGLPVIATDGLGTGEILRGDDGDVYPGVGLIPARREPTGVDHPYYAGRNWWAVNESDVRRAMRDVYENYPEWKAAALQGSEQARRERSCHVAAWEVRQHLNRIYQEYGPFPREYKLRRPIGFGLGCGREGRGQWNGVQTAK